MKILSTGYRDDTSRFYYRSVPEGLRETIDPKEAVREGLVGELGDLNEQMIEEAETPELKSKLAQYLIDGPLFGPLRLWRRRRERNRQTDANRQSPDK